MREAADEIERLTEALESIAAFSTGWGPVGDTIYRAACDALDARLPAEIDHGPAMRARHHDKGYPFGERVPKTIRITRYVAPNWLLSVIDRMAGAPVQRAETYPAWTNSYGAVAAIFPDGTNLGVKPGEFEVVEWFDVARLPASGKE